MEHTDCTEQCRHSKYTDILAGEITSHIHCLILIQIVCYESGKFKGPVTSW